MQHLEVRKKKKDGTLATVKRDPLAKEKKETELELGKVYLNLLLKIFNIDNIIALGRKPESKLKGFGYHYGYIRHPANGGKNKFVNGLKEVLKWN